MLGTDNGVFVPAVVSQGWRVDYQEGRMQPYRLSRLTKGSNVEIVFFAESLEEVQHVSRLMPK